jgi:group II intron reverse transcriptase/maturase
MAFTSLAYLMDIEWLMEAYRRTRKDGAVGVDGVTAEAYEQDLEGNLQRLLDRAKSGTYKAPPVRRVHIPKGNSTTETRPIGIPTLEDKILQRAAVMLLDPIYEQDFLDCSYGFRRGRSAHDALNSFRDQTMRHWRTGLTVLEVDIRKFFENLDHQYLRQFLQLRVRDGVLLRLIDKWLKAGVMEDGNVSYPDSGSPQGGVVSPLISNVFLHYVLDLWFEHEVKPRLHGQAFLIRYADDFVIGFRNDRDAERVMEVLPKRFGKHGLTVHPTKTKLISFRPPPVRRDDDDDRPGTFDLLGFTHYWGVSLKGYWVVKLKTAKDRFTRAVRSIDRWCHDNRHLPLEEQQHTLKQKLRGHYAYYGVTGNSDALNRFRQEVENRWRKWLNRRNNLRSMHWQKFCALLRRYPLAPARAVRSKLLPHAAKP